MKKICKKGKYRIAYVMHRGEVSTYGGFPSHVEHSIYGLKKLGHEVDFYFIGNINKPNDKFIKNKIKTYEKGGLMIEGQRASLDVGIGTGLYYHVNFGWLCPTTPIKNYEDKVKFRDKLETYDAVFWHTPFWFKQNSYQKDTDWVMLLDLKNPVNIGFHHDGNIRANSAWMIHIDKYFDRWITVHPASFNACSVFKTPRCLIFNPQILDNVDWDHTNSQNLDNPVFFSLQYWKASKHVDDLVRAIPHLYMMRGNPTVVLGGRGMEYSYMNSEEKIKPNYISDRKFDPDLPEEFLGYPIIKLARSFGGSGVIETQWMSSKERDEILKMSSFFVDTAYYSVSKALGEHFSRTLIEAMMAGVVPIARNLALSDNEEGIGDIFKPDENYLMIRHDATPKEFAVRMVESMGISREEYDRIVMNNYELLKHFDIDYVCGEYIKVIRGEDCGYYNGYSEGGGTPEGFLERADRQWYGDGTRRNFSFKRDN